MFYLTILRKSKVPYSSTKELPKAVSRLPGKAKRTFLATFNSAFRTYNGDETKAFKVAWSSVKNKFHKSGDKWVSKQDNGGTSMHKRLEDLKSVYTKALEQASVGEMLPIKEVVDCLDKVSS